MINSNKKMLKSINFQILICTFTISIIGIITISSATHTYEDKTHYLFISQGIWLIISSIVGFLILIVDYNTIGGYYKVLYVFSNFLLIVVLLMGSVRNNARSWLGIGSLGIQPSEFAKIVTIIVIAKIMEDMENINTIKNLFKIILLTIIPMGLIQLQPDTGTNIIFFITILGMMFVAGLDLKIISVGLIISIISCFAIWNSSILMPYQRSRILVFLNPGSHSLNSGYQALTTKTAIGSGQFFGMGLYNGIHTTGKFIPEASTDFIFSVFGEEWGFLGSIILLFLYMIIISNSIKIAKNSKDKYGTYMVIGILTMIGFQIFQNIGMNIGIIPITGITLPFMSYGGSSLLTNIISITLILNVGIRKFKITF